MKNFELSAMVEYLKSIEIYDAILWFNHIDMKYTDDTMDSMIWYDCVLCTFIDDWCWSSSVILSWGWNLQ